MSVPSSSGLASSLLTAAPLPNRNSSKADSCKQQLQDKTGKRHRRSAAVRNCCASLVGCD
jgi:hypothetical protein